MTRFHKHLFIYLSILAQAYSYAVEINGELSFDMRISDVLRPFYDRAIDHEDMLPQDTEEKSKENQEEEVDEEQSTEESEEEEEEAEKEEKEEENEDTKEVHQEKLSGVTAAPVVECLYQYPDLVQFNAMLSNMMNELTKVFVGVHKLMRKRDGRRHQETRYKVVNKKDTRFFESVYSNMTKEYSQFYNNTAGRVARAAEDPCENQEELKEVWRELLERSLSSLQRAALKCIEEYLRSTNRTDDKRTRNKLKQYLTRELAKVRSTQLHMLCDSFQLCYNDLL